MPKLTSPLTVLAILALLMNCQKDDAAPDNPTVACIGTVETPSPLFTCEDLLDQDDQFYCTIELVGDHALDDSSKPYLQQYCTKTGTTLVFENEQGETLELQLTEKSYSKSNLTYNTFLPCENELNKTIGHCINNERLSIQLESPSNNIYLRLQITTIPDVQDVDVNQFGDVLQISRQNENGTWFGEFEAVVSQRTLSYESTFNQISINELQLHNQTYRNVLSVDPTIFANPVFQYYFNAELGLIGFVDLEGAVWRWRG